MTLACSILAALAVLDHEKVLVAIGDSARFTAKHRFWYIVKALTVNNNDAKVCSFTGLIIARLDLFILVRSVQ